jgi:hypothetical protein
LITDVELETPWHRRALSIYPNTGRTDVPLASCLTQEIADKIVLDHNSSIPLPGETEKRG